MAKIPVTQPTSDANASTTATEANNEGAVSTPSTTDANGLDTPEKYKSEVDQYETAIKKADEKRAKFIGDDELTTQLRDMFKQINPDLFAIIMSESDTLRAELKAYKLSQMSQEQKDLTSSYLADEEEFERVRIKRDASFKALNDKYPQDSPKKSRAPKAEGAATAENKPFSGTLLTKEAATAKVLELVAKGVTSETEMITTIYGTDFTISGSSPRSQIHAIRLEKNLVKTK